MCIGVKNVLQILFWEDIALKTYRKNIEKKV